MRTIVWIVVLVACRLSGDLTTVVDVARFEDLYRQLCPRTSFCNYVYNGSEAPCCRPCSCDPDCGKTVSCCADALDSYRLHERNNFTCISTKPSNYKDALRNAPHFEYLMIASCPENGSYEMMEKCLHENSTVFGSVWPVYSADTGLVYKNMYCANCSGARVTDVWKIHILPSRQGKYGVENLNIRTFASPLYNVVLRSPETVDLSQFECGLYVYRQCNSTGRWKEYDPEIERACLTINSEFRISPYTTYTNIFCYRCDTFPRPDLGCSTRSGPYFSIEDPVTFQLLLSSNKWPSETAGISDRILCESMQFYDPFKKRCSNLLCPVLSQLHDGICIPKVTYFQKMKLVKTSIELSYEEDVSITIDDLDFLREHFVNYFQATILSELCQIDFCYNSSKNVLKRPIYLSIVTLVANISHLYSDMDNAGEYLLKKWSFSVNNQSFVFRSKFADPYEHLYTCQYLQSTKLFSTPACNDLRAVSYHSDMLLLPKTAFCKVVALGKTDYVEDPTLGGFSYKCIRLLTSNNNTCLSGSEYTPYVLDNGTESILVCLEDYLESEHLPPRHFDQKITVGYQSLAALLSVVCSVISIVSIIVTLVVYGLFKELRSLPGKLNMILLTNLLVAQSSLTFGVGEADIAPLCIGIGMLIHFSWLSAMFWMTAACVQMFCTFAKIDSVLFCSEPKLITIYSAACYGVAFVCVSVNTFKSLILSQFSDLGYGPDLCYINSNLMMTLTFAVPVGLVIAVNSILYFGVAYTLYQHHAATQHLNVERNYMEYCMRLSSITGTTWVAGFVYEWTQFWLFEYFFVCLMALQGLFIMVSFVFTSRVWLLVTKSFQDDSITAG